jgi:hypothetical protein
MPCLQYLLGLVFPSLQENNIILDTISQIPIVPQIPQWEHCIATFDNDYTHTPKSDESQRHILITEVKSHLENRYPLHLKIFTDGSVLDSKNSGAAFVIPSLKVQKSFYLGKQLSVFSCELYAIFMSLSFILSCPLDMFNILICVDSKSVLIALQSWNSKVRRELIFE